MIVEDLTAFLQADAGIASIAAGRVYPLNLPQNSALPALVYRQSAGKRPSTMENRNGFSHAAFRISCMAMSYKESKQLSEKLRLALEGFSGTMGATTVLGTFLEHEDDVYQPVELEFRTDLEFKIFHREP